MKSKFLVILTTFILSSHAWALDTISASVMADHLNRMPHSESDPHTLSPAMLRERILWSYTDPEVLRLSEAEQRIIKKTAVVWGVPLERAAMCTLFSSTRGVEGAPFRDTRNERGSEICIRSPFHDRVLGAIGEGTRVLDLGSAYGYTTRLALEKGATVVAVDMSALHIATLVNATPPDQRHRLSVSISEFPREFTPIADGSFDVVVAGLLIHYLPGDHVKNLFQSAYRWLASRGSFFVMASTAELPNFKAIRTELSQRIEHAKLSIVGIELTPDAMVFPTDLSDDTRLRISGQLIHPAEVHLTRFNLRCAGFRVGATRQDFGTFSTAKSDGEYIWVSVLYDGIGEGCRYTPYRSGISFAKQGDDYFYIRAVKE